MEGKIYVLDDEGLIRKSATLALQRLGDVKASGLWSEHATDLLTPKPEVPRVLICDLDMPGISGADLCRIVRKHNPDVRILMFTGRPEAVPEGVADQVLAKRSGLGALRDATAALLLQAQARARAASPSADLLNSGARQGWSA